jgi:hypothetical protein
VLILFTRVSEPPAIAPETAIWHFGWHVPDSRAALEIYRSCDGLELLPLYTGDAQSSVLISSDTWPGSGGILGRTRAEIVEAQATRVEPTRRAGFAYMRGPDRAIVEYAGNHPSQRFNHVHMWQEDPLCAELWYQEHLQATPLTNRSDPVTETNCKVVRGEDRSFPALEPDGMFRTPSGGVAFGNVWLPWYMRQGDAPLADSRGHVYDHIALSVVSLDPWIEKLERAGITFLAGPYALGETRAVMISGPSLETIELLEAS